MLSLPMVLLQWFSRSWLAMLVLVCVPVYATATQGSAAEGVVVAAASAAVVDRLRDEILRRVRNRIAARQWKAGGLKGYVPAPATVLKAPRKRAAAELNPSAAEGEISAEETPPKARRTVPADARHPHRPWRDKWETQDEFADWLFVENGYVYCRCMASAARGS